MKPFVIQQEPTETVPPTQTPGSVRPLGPQNIFTIAGSTLNPEDDDAASKVETREEEVVLVPSPSAAQPGGGPNQTLTR